MNPTLWNDILGRIETKVNRYSFYTWFKPTVCVSDDGQKLTVRVPNLLFRDWLTKHYSAVLDEALAEVGRPQTEIAFVADTHSGFEPGIEAVPVDLGFDAPEDVAPESLRHTSRPRQGVPQSRTFAPKMAAFFVKTRLIPLTKGRKRRFPQ